MHGVPPTGTVQVDSGGGSLNRYPAGTQVQFERISGHRDGDATACPGDGLYSAAAAAAADGRRRPAPSARVDLH